MKKFYLIPLTAAVALAVSDGGLADAAAGVAQAKGNQTGKMVSLPRDAMVPGRCAAPATSMTYRIRVPRSLGDLSDRRYVRFRTNEPTPDDTDSRPDTENAGTAGTEFASNPLHVDLSGIAGTPWIRVRAILKDPNLTFLDIDDVPPALRTGFPAGLKGVLYTPQTPGTPIPWICQPNNNPVRDNQHRPAFSVATFFIQKGSYPDLSINLVVVPRDALTSPDNFGLQTPILIDPKIHNDG